MPLPIVDDFTVMVKRLGPDQAKALGELTTETKYSREKGITEEVTNVDKWNRHAPDFYIDATECTGLTNSAIRKLGIELDEDLAAGDGGLIAPTAELMRELWENAVAAKFMLPILHFSREMLTVAELQKKSDLPTFDGSS